MLRRRSPFAVVIKILIASLLLVAAAGCDGPGRDQLMVTWTTESELDVVGYNLYRSEMPDGPFVKLNEQLIQPAADPFLGGSYEYVDDDVRRGVTYYYQLETVDRLGGTTRTEPITLTAGG